MSLKELEHVGKTVFGSSRPLLAALEPPPPPATKNYSVELKPEPIQTQLWHTVSCIPLEFTASLCIPLEFTASAAELRRQYSLDKWWQNVANLQAKGTQTSSDLSFSISTSSMENVQDQGAMCKMQKINRIFEQTSQAGRPKPLQFASHLVRPQPQHIGLSDCGYM